MTVKYCDQIKLLALDWTFIIKVLWYRFIFAYEMEWNEMRYSYPAHMINQQHKEGG